ncbi:MAG: polyphosphate kinase 1 [Pirellulales bacterium]|nr:polyphosphate kinase 1 [Pirellulales bacterium]
MSDTKPQFFNRELSWLEFNQRVLDEALNTTIPLLERLKFLAITASNLDEFFMVRVGSLKIMVDQNIVKADQAGLSPSQQLDAISQRVHKMVADQYRCFAQELQPGLSESGIQQLTVSSLSDSQRSALEERFLREIYPVISPIGIDPESEIPLIANQVLQLAVLLKTKNEEAPFRLAIIPLGAPTPRFINQSSDGGREYLLIEDVLSELVHHYFPSGEEAVIECPPFRISRNADMAVRDDMAADLMHEMEEMLDARKMSECVRLEVDASVSQQMLKMLKDVFKVDVSFVYPCNGPLDLKSFFEISGTRGFDELKYETWAPTNCPAVDLSESMFTQIAANDVLLVHPFDSFDPVVRLIEEASDDPNVLAIKQTLYRTSRSSPIVAALARAASRGKNVTVIVELKARFDEANNIEGARFLEQSGVHVVYGVRGFKTHAKCCIIVRREPQGVRRYMHFGTGNYNESTAKLYTDVSLMTANEQLGLDATTFFNSVTGFTQPRTLEALYVAPMGIRNRILKLIEFETKRAAAGKRGTIAAKMNSLVDPKIIKALYKASQAGVKVTLNIRGICCLTPGVPGLSENIRVISIIDRFLEHSRIIYAYHGGDEVVYISSADWMPRNLDRRIELLVPVTDSECRQKLINTLNTCLADNVKAKVLQADGSYALISTDDKALRSQAVLQKSAEDLVKHAKNYQATTYEAHRGK